MEVKLSNKTLQTSISLHLRSIMELEADRLKELSILAHFIKKIQIE